MQSPTNSRKEAFWLSSLFDTVVGTGHTTKHHEFERVTLAFEVDLQLLSSDKLDVNERTAKELAYAATQQTKTSQRAIIKHLIINLRSAFLPLRMFYIPH